MWLSQSCLRPGVFCLVSEVSRGPGRQEQSLPLGGLGSGVARPHARGAEEAGALHGFGEAGGEKPM